MSEKFEIGDRIRFVADCVSSETDRPPLVKYALKGEFGHVLRGGPAEYLVKPEGPRPAKFTPKRIRLRILSIDILKGSMRRFGLVGSGVRNPSGLPAGELIGITSSASKSIRHYEKLNQQNNHGNRTTESSPKRQLEA